MNNTMADRIFRRIRAERVRHDLKCGEQNHLMVEWMPILMEEVGEAAKDISEAHFCLNSEEQMEKARAAEEELIQVAAVCVAMIECLGRNGFIGNSAVDWPLIYPSEEDFE